MTSNSETARERITPKDIMRIMGFQKSKAYRYYNELRSKKPGMQAEFLGVDDLAAATGMKRQSIKENMR
jgi:predicted DNA-binding transcriptional regulator AlpA